MKKDSKIQFIQFSEVHKLLLTEVKAKLVRELDSVLKLVYKDLGILKDIEQNPMKYHLKEDFSGVDVLLSEESKVNE